MIEQVMPFKYLRITIINSQDITLEARDQASQYIAICDMLNGKINIQQRNQNYKYIREWYDIRIRVPCAYHKNEGNDSAS